MTDVQITTPSRSERFRAAAEEILEILAEMEGEDLEGLAPRRRYAGPIDAPPFEVPPLAPEPTAPKIGETLTWLQARAQKSLPLALPERRAEKIPRTLTILRRASARGLTAQQLAEALGITRNAATLRLRTLLRRGEAILVGHGRASRWFASSQVHGRQRRRVAETAAAGGAR